MSWDILAATPLDILRNLNALWYWMGCDLARYVICVLAPTFCLLQLRCVKKAIEPYNAYQQIQICIGNATTQIRYFVESQF